MFLRSFVRLFFSLMCLLGVDVHRIVLLVLVRFVGLVGWSNVCACLFASLFVVDVAFACPCVCLTC